jgi:hypothetical protein
MPNDFSSLISAMPRILEVTTRSLTGFIPAVTLDPAADMIAKGQTIKFNEPDQDASAGFDITPAMALPAAAYETPVVYEHSLTNFRGKKFSYTQEDTKAVGANGLTFRQNQVAQKISELLSEVEASVALAARKAASRATGTAGTTPFASTLAGTVDARKILVDNKMVAEAERSLILNTAASGNMMLLFNKVNEAGTDSFLRQGVFARTHGFDIRESAEVATVTKGTGSGYLVNSASLAAGDTTIPCDTGTGTILAGDVVTFAGDTNKYVVKTALASGSFVIQEPGLLAAPADNAAITVGNNFTANVALARHSVILSTRLPAADEDDLAKNREVVTDSRSGISFEFAQYPGYRMSTFEVAIAWGVTAVQPRHIALLLG